MGARRRMGLSFAAVTLLASVLVAGGQSLAGEDCVARREPESRAAGALRVVAVAAGQDDVEVARRIAGMGANAMATSGGPNAAAGLAAEASELRYIPFMSTRDVDRLLTDEAFLLQVRAVPGLSGFVYRDVGTVEGYTSPAAQQRAYGILKTLFSGALVLHATRLDPVAMDPTYLDRFFRPEFTDLVAPYFYPVGTTILGTQEEGDPWEARLLSLLTPLAERMPPDKGILPVLQAFEQTGYPVTGAFGRRQLDVYRRLWPDSANVAAFWWGGGSDEPLRGLSEVPALLDGFRRLFGGAPSRSEPCVIPQRRSSP
ncbi:MAG TPA: hypothetical protein VGL03_12880 [Thermoanaerobaculia bacterium]|jgi:hypothetical protein